MNAYPIYKRDRSIDILKCLAALLITWSHFEKPLGEYAALATGGALGDALFFFCSGYTLFLGKKSNGFFNWYKRRINRIYPTVFAWAFIRSFLPSNSQENMLHIIISGGGFFVSSIMIFYALLYNFIKYASGKLLNSALIVSLTLSCGSFFVFDIKDSSIHYLCTWSMYFCVMLFGGIIGKQKQENTQRSKCISVTIGGGNLFLLGLLIFGVVGYYTCLYIEKLTGYIFLRFTTVFPLLLFVYSLHRICLMPVMKVLYDNRYTHAYIMFVGNLCLEIYLVQPMLLTDNMNALFPVNILLMYIIILLCAYLLKCMSCIWAQTFSSGNYDWKSILKVYENR